MVKLFLVLILVSLSFLCISVYAAGTPAIISYQGRLADSSGDLLGDTGTTYYFKFSIWDDATVDSGNRLWPSSAPATTTATVRHGVFNVNIGDTAGGYLDALDYDFNTNSDIYLQVEVSSDNISSETLSPRQRISSAVFAQMASVVSGTGQSMMGTTTPVSGAVVTIEATSTSAIPLAIRGFMNQAADLFRIVSSTGTRLLTFTSGGSLGIGTSTPTNKLNVLDADSTAQLRLSQTGSIYGELYLDSSGDVRIYSTNSNVRLNDEDLWVCAEGSCGASDPAGEGNIIIENAVILNNDFMLKYVDATTTVMYDSGGNDILWFDEVDD